MAQLTAMQKKSILALADSLCHEVRHFSKAEVVGLIGMYHELMGDSSAPDRAVTGLDRSKFRMFLFNTFRMTDSLIMDRVFRIFDKDNDGIVSKKEWVIGLSVFLRGTIEEKMKYCFRVYDLNDDGFISKDEIFEMLKDCFIIQPTDEDPYEEARELVEIVLKMMDQDHDGQLSFDDFEKSVKKEDLLLEGFGTCLPEEPAVEAFEQRAFQKQLWL